MSQKRDVVRERCPVTGKWSYPKKKDARLILEKMNGGRQEGQEPIGGIHGARSPQHRLSVYRGECCGLWHVGNRYLGEPSG